VYLAFQDLVIAEFKSRGAEPVPGVSEAFRVLRASGVGVVLCTGFDTRIAAEVIGLLEWRNLVDGVVTSDDVARGRPAPDLIYRAMRELGVASARAVVAVGDTVNDLEAAAAAGVGASIGVLTGAHDRSRLAAAPHTAILASAAEVPAWLARRGWMGALE